MRDDEAGPVVMFAARLGLLWLPMLVLGASGGMLGWRPAAWVMLAAVCGEIASHLVVGTIVYRSVMGRAWPDVPPLSDDDW